MLQGLWLKYEEKIYSLIPPLLFIYIFFQPFNHFAGIRNTAFFFMLPLFLIKLGRKGIGHACKGFNSKINWKDSTMTALFILLIVILVSIFFSNYIIDSLNAFRKNFFYQLVVFFVILTEFRDIEKLRALLGAVVLSFVTLTIIIFIKNPPSNLLNILEAKADRETFLSGYALNAAFYIPFTLGYIFSMKDRIVFRGIFWIMLLAEFTLVWLYYSSRTTLIAILISTVVIIAMSKRYKMLAIIIVFFLVIGGITYFKKPELIDRYKTLLSFQTYTNNVGLSGRGYIWKGTIDIIKDRPIIGHGYGWKKLALVTRDGGYLERWKEKWPETCAACDYLGAGYGKANPHNLVLQILFEVGILGLSAFVLFWVTICVKVVKIIKSGTEDELNCFVKYGATGVLVAYSIVNMTNGLWEESYGIITFVLAAVILVIYEQTRCQDH